MRKFGLWTRRDRSRHDSFHRKRQKTRATSLSLFVCGCVCVHLATLSCPCYVTRFSGKSTLALLFNTEVSGLCFCLCFDNMPFYMFLTIFAKGAQKPITMSEVDGWELSVSSLKEATKSTVKTMSILDRTGMPYRYYILSLLSCLLLPLLLLPTIEISVCFLSIETQQLIQIGWLSSVANPFALP